MTGQSRFQSVLESAFLLLACLHLVWRLMFVFVAAHPVEQSRGALPLSAALVCAAGAPFIRSPIARKLVIVIGAVLVLVSFLAP
jgi:hypothetical protein